MLYSYHIHIVLIIKMLFYAIHLPVHLTYFHVFWEERINLCVLNPTAQIQLKLTSHVNTILTWSLYNCLNIHLYLIAHIWKLEYQIFRDIANTFVNILNKRKNSIKVIHHITTWHYCTTELRKKSTHHNKPLKQEEYYPA